MFYEYPETEKKIEKDPPPFLQPNSNSDRLYYIQSLQFIQDINSRICKPDFFTMR